MAVSRIRDMTTGPVRKTLLLFALPILCSNLLQHFYNLVDTTLAGNIYGERALAAIGASSSIYALLVTLASGMNGGFELVLARAFGSHDEEKYRCAVCTMLVLNLATSVCIGALSCALIRPILRLMNTPQDIFSEAARYITIILAGLPITALYNMEASLMRSLGNSRTPLLFLMLASLANIVLDLAAIVLLDWGVAGLAAATMLSQLISAVLCFLYIRRRYPELHFTRAHARPRAALYREMFCTGLSMALMSSIFSIGSVCVQSAINNLGTLTITAHTAARKLTEFMCMPQVAIAQAQATFVSQNYGAGRISRCRQGWQANLLLGTVVTLAVVLIGAIFGEALIRAISGSQNAQVLSNGLMYLRIETAGFPILVVLQATRMFMQGVGKKIVPIISSSIELIGKLLFTWIFIPRLGYLGVCLSEPILWVACTLFLVGSYLKVNRSLQEGAQTI